MKPQFATVEAWEQADCLMQPALIRTIDQLRQALETIPWRSRYEEVQDPIPGHQLILENGDRLYRVNIWDLCFQICFANYNPRPFVDNLPDNQDELWVEIDQTLFNEENVDWTALDHKAQACIQTMIAALPPVNDAE
ncbi:MAG: hypothetical protein VKJ27_12715 [Synechocystis sp.]|nr:hypothetical protein [Synechocystis sp.]